MTASAWGVQPSLGTLTTVRLITRIGLFSALVYVFSWATVYLPNVSLIFFIVFSAGFLWGKTAGMLVGVIGMGVWTTFNPYGPAHLYIMLAQIGGASISGLVGCFFRRWCSDKSSSLWFRLKLALLGGLCALLYFLPVIIVDAWLFGPFWVRLIAGLPWVGFSIVANMIIYPALFGVTRRILKREAANC